MVSPDTKMCQPLRIPLILCKTIGKNKNFSSSVTMRPKIFVLFEINNHHTTPIACVITHKFCHLVHHNHTKEFYALLTNEMPLFCYLPRMFKNGLSLRLSNALISMELKSKSLSSHSRYTEAPFSRWWIWRLGL